MLLKHKEVTDSILKAFFTVYAKLGYGFLEKVYENAMLIELGGMNVTVQRQHPIKVLYDGIVIGEYFADLLVMGIVIVELKASPVVADSFEAKLLNYLKATEIEVGLLLNFGPKPEFRRKLYTNDRKLPIMNPLNPIDPSIP